MPSDIIRAARAYFKHTTENAECEQDRALRAALDALPENVVGYQCASCLGQWTKLPPTQRHLGRQLDDGIYEECFGQFVALLAVPMEDIEKEAPDGGE